MLCNPDFSWEEGVDCSLVEDEMQAICERVLAEENVTRPCFVSLSIVSDERIREINRDWRSIDAPTDVISLECERPDDADLGEDEPCELGDIILAPHYIACQSRTFGTTPADETRLLLVHGMLHLLGYDHIADDEASVMEAREDELLALLPTDNTLSHATLTRHEGEGRP